MSSEVERRGDGEDLGAHLVKPGEILVVKRDAVLMTVIAKGIAVCIWNETARSGGMCHFLKPSILDRSKTTATYGNVAVATLISLIKKEFPRGELEAHVIGGAVRDSGDEQLSQSNLETARRALGRHGIPIVSEDVGGFKGRKILFDTSTGHCATLKVHDLRAEDWDL